MNKNVDELQDLFNSELMTNSIPISNPESLYLKNNQNTIKENKNYKEINNKMLEENCQKQNLEKEIENLNEIIKEKEKEIEELKEENEKSKKNVTSFSNINKRDSSKELENRISLVGEGNEQETIKRLVERLKEIKNENEADKELIKIMKEDQKNMKAKLAGFETFGGKIKDYNEFIKLFNIILKDYKPKKKEQKEALAKLKEHLKKELD